MYKLFYSPGACSMAVHVCLNECGQDVELVNAELHGEKRNPDFVKINPRGQVPVLVDSGHVIREGAAQIIHILEKHNNPLMPKSGFERAAALEWLCWANSTLHPAYSRAFGAKRYQDDAVKNAVLAAAFPNIQKLWDEADAHLAQNPYLAGTQMTAADILMAVIANWSAGFDGKITLGANIKRVIREVIARPAYQKALAAEQVQYKVAA